MRCQEKDVVSSNSKVYKFRLIKHIKIGRSRAKTISHLHFFPKLRYRRYIENSTFWAKLVMPHWRKFGQFMLHRRIKSDVEEISQKFNFWLKDTVSGKFLKALWALNKRPERNGIKNFKIPILFLEDRPICSEICKIHLNAKA